MSILTGLQEAAIAGLEEYYNANAGEELIAATIPATEHSVMCAGGKEDELETFRRLITEVYPTGFVSIVSDTWDFWKVMTEYLPKLKDEILARDGRLVIRPDSGNPVHIIAGYKQEDFENWREQVEAFKIISHVEWVGAYEVLWKTFGGTINEKGYKVLNPKVGIIYGDSTKNVICSKVRDPKTGQLSGFKIENPEVIEENQDLPLVVIDDLCDGGGTFKGIAQLLESHCPNRDRAIYVTHMVNPKGIATLSENYKEVYFTNSYRDWGREVLPNNVKVIEVV